MSRVRDRGVRRAGVSPTVLEAAGLVALVAFVHALVTTAPLSTALPERTLEFLLLGLPAIALVFAGYWLESCDLTDDEVGLVGWCAVGGGVVASTTTTAVLALLPVTGVDLASLFFLLVSAGTEGTLLGFIFGTLVLTDAITGGDTSGVAFADDGAASVVGDPSSERAGGTAPDDRRTASDGVASGASGDSSTTQAPTATADEAHPGSEPRTATNGGAVVAASTSEPAESRTGDVDDDSAELASLVAHDLRSPLNVAQAHLEYVRNEGEVDDHLEKVARSHDRMAELIADALALARATERAVDVEPVSLAGLVEDCRRQLELEDATVVVETRQRVVADEAKLRRLVENLLRNAVEHSSTSPRSQTREDAADHADGPVTVTVGDCDGGFYVADDGPGIPPEDRVKIFERGYTTSDSGTGFGLSIVDTVAEMHGWSVDVGESEAGGARFEVTGVEREEIC